MEIIIRGMQTGKTTDLIKLSHSEGGTIVCRNRREADRIMAVARHAGLEIPVPVTHGEFIRRDGDFAGRGISCVLLDDADDLLARLGGVEIGAIAVTAGE